MQITEAITIYLAAGAPFGASCYLRRKRGGGRTQALLGLLCATLIWPLAASRLLWRQIREKTDGENRPHSQELRARHEEKVEQARRQLLASLHRIEELARALSEKEGHRSERVVCMVHESLGKYVGLTLGAREAVADGPPLESEMELCRIAGRTGADLLLAGRCIHRRNVTRLLAHREHARTALLHALAEVREMSEDDSTTATSSAPAKIVTVPHLSVAILRFYGEAINLLSLLEDKDAVRKVARLLDAECARLRRLEALSPNRSDDNERPAGEEQCRPHTPHLAFTGPSQTSPLTRG